MGSSQFSRKIPDNRIRRDIEVVITGLTRNRLFVQERPFIESLDFSGFLTFPRFFEVAQFHSILSSLHQFSPFFGVLMGGTIFGEISKWS